MQQTLLVAGLACLIAAVVGGGLKAFGIEIPVLKSGVRQAALGVLGIALVAAATMVDGDGLQSFRTEEDLQPSRTEEPRGGDTDDAESGDAPPSDFPEGSVRAYSADFATWPTQDSEHGSVSLGFGNSLVLKPSSNTWIGPGRAIDIPSIEGDFVCDVRFRIEERSPSASLHVSFAGAGDDAETIDVYLSIWRDDNVTYTLNKGRVRSGEGLAVPHVVTEAVIAEREQLPPAVRDQNWSTGSELTLKREGGQMQFFVDDQFVKAFDVSLFSVEEVSIGAAQKSTIVVTSIEFRVRP